MIKNYCTTNGVVKASLHRAMVQTCHVLSMFGTWYIALSMVLGWSHSQCNVFTFRIYPSYWANRPCREAWHGNLILHKGWFWTVLWLETHDPVQSSVNLSTWTTQSSRCSTQARHCSNEETTGGEDICLKRPQWIPPFYVSQCWRLFVQSWPTPHKTVFPRFYGIFEW